MLYNIYDWTHEFDLKKDLRSDLTTGSYNHEYSKTEEEVLQHVRSELYDIYKYDDKDPRTKIWIDEYGKVNCLVWYINIYGFVGKLMQVEPVKEDAE